LTTTGEQIIRKVLARHRGKGNLEEGQGCSEKRGVLHSLEKKTASERASPRTKEEKKPAERERKRRLQSPREISSYQKRKNRQD